MAEVLYNVYLWDYNKPEMLQNPIIVRHVPYNTAVDMVDEYFEKSPSWDGFLVLDSEDENE